LDQARLYKSGYSLQSNRKTKEGAVAGSLGMAAGTADRVRFRQILYNLLGKRGELHGGDDGAALSGR
jgi:hypothetical protein